MYCGCQRTVAPEGTLPVVDPGGGAEDHLGQVEGLLFPNTAETVEISVADRQKPPIWTHTKRTFWKDLPWRTDPSCKMSHSCHGCLSRHGKKAKRCGFLFSLRKNIDNVSMFWNLLTSAGDMS